MRHFQRLLNRYKTARSKNVPPPTASASVNPPPELRASIRARASGTAHDTEAYLEDAHYATTVAEAMQAPHDIRSTDGISPLDHNPEMISAEPSLSSYDQQCVEDAFQEHDVDADRLGGYMESADDPSGNLDSGVQLISLGLANLYNRTSILTQRSAQGIHEQHESQFISTLCETPFKQYEELTCHSTAQSESAICEDAESPTEEIAQHLLTIVNEFRRDTSISDFGELDPPSHKIIKPIAGASVDSSYTDDIMSEIDKMIEAYNPHTWDEASETSSLSVELSDIASLDGSQLALNTNHLPSTTMSVLSLGVPHVNSRSPSLNSRLLTPKHHGPTIAVESASQHNSVATSLYPPRMDFLFDTKTTNTVSDALESESATESKAPPPIPQRSPARPKVPAHLVYLPRTAITHVPVYISKGRVGPNFRGQWNIVDFGPIPKAGS
ncbi:hypothetical protein PMIN01_11213 [Paraphaeosphaeria minitans]|uniref:Uncharacterized protein n=1 Tax=Paraphaeosphaeria minitans TaxID=565426 RepID=A0A9P6KLC0_9PLEO|nr:hypothetical protein PMIN01_11213 [Paraphaeosphaeria minitans]